MPSCTCVESRWCNCHPCLVYNLCEWLTFNLLFGNFLFTCVLTTSIEEQELDEVEQETPSQSSNPIGVRKTS